MVGVRKGNLPLCSATSPSPGAVTAAGEEALRHMSPVVLMPVSAPGPLTAQSRLSP